MSSVGSVGGSSTLQVLQQLSGSSGISKSSGGPSPAKFEVAVKDAGGANIDLDALQSKIEAAVKSVVQNADHSSEPSTIGTKIQQAVDQVLKDSGIDTDKLKSELGAPLDGGPGGSPFGRAGGPGGTRSSDIHLLLSALKNSSSTDATTDSSSTSESSSTSSTPTTSSTDTSKSLDDLVQQLLSQVLKNMPAGSVVNTSV